MIKIGQKFKHMSEKIDTQGMSGEAVEGCKDNVYPKDVDGNCIYPPANFKVWPIFEAVSYTHLRAHETPEHLGLRVVLDKK